jgi:L-ascorbate metabolism protein UlaG (beta-lactamase superfamily)
MKIQLIRNPTVDLPFGIKEIVEGIESVVVSHDHPDHFDQAASEALPKTIPR